MIGRCTKTQLNELSPDENAHVSRYVHAKEVHLVIGMEYPILGMAMRDGRVWFFVCEDEQAQYPKPHFSGLFELVDNRIPPGWSLAMEHLNAGSMAVLPEMWAADPVFMERLIEREPAAVAVFEAIKTRVSAWHSALTSK